jgi:hypothetical protein
MSEMAMNNEVETEEFTDELSDEALDREGGGKPLLSLVGCSCRAGS